MQSKGLKFLPVVQSNAEFKIYENDTEVRAFLPIDSITLNAVRGADRRIKPRQYSN